MTDQQRPNRADEEAARRRRRDGSGLTRSLNLAIPEDVRAKLAEEGRSPRWVNDTKSRIADLTTRDDYDRVQDVSPVRVGTDEAGQPIFAVLLAKRSEFLTEDRAAAEKRRRDTEAGMMRGKIPVPGSDAQPMEGAMGATTYVDPASKIGRANQVLD